MNKNTPVGKGVRTGYQAIFATLVGFLYGLWSLPGVPEYITEFIRTHGVELLITLAALVGIPAGIIAFVQNRLGK